MGLQTYGEFVALSATAFFVQRLVDFPMETLAYSSKNEITIFIRGFSIQLFFFIGTALFNYFDIANTNLLLLLSLQISSIAFSMVLSKRCEKLTFQYLLFFSIIYSTLIAFVIVNKISIINSLILINASTIIWWAIPLKVYKLQPNHLTLSFFFISELKTALLRLFVGLFSTVLTLGMPLLLSSVDAVLNAKVRLLGTIIMMSAFLLPWPLKSLISILEKNPQTIEKLNYYLLFLFSASVFFDMFLSDYTTLKKYTDLPIASFITLSLTYLIIERLLITISGVKASAIASIIATITLTTISIFNLNQTAIQTLKLACFCIVIYITLAFYLTIIKNKRKHSSKSITFIYVIGLLNGLFILFLTN